MSCRNYMPHRPQLARRALLILLWAAPAGAVTDTPAEPSSPVAGRGLAAPGDPQYTATELEELADLESTVQRFEREAADYRAATRKLIESKYKQKRDTLFQSYERIIVALEDEQRERRETAIAKFERFLERYPSDPRYTPDSMFRLSELYFERSYDTYFHARQAFDKKMETWEPDSGAPEPMEPQFHYEATIAMMQRLITEFPDYRLVDGAYYLLGYCLGEQGEEDRAVDVYEELVSRRSASRFAPEVWTRIGEYYFNNNQLEEALFAYTQVLEHRDSPFYDKALYKLAWTHYRMADPERAPEEYQKAVDTFVALLDFNEETKAAGNERGRDLRPESVQYVAICYADEEWGGTDAMLAYLEGLGDKPYEREVLVALADVYFDQTRFDEAVRVYQIALERYPDHEDAPKLQNQIVVAAERKRDFDTAAEAREVLTRHYSEGSDWYEKNRNNPDALAAANELTEKSLYSAALFHHRQAQIHKEAGKIDLAQEAYGRAAEAYGEYLRRFPHDKQLYELTYYYAEALYYSLQFDAAATAYTRVRDSNADNKFLVDSAFSVVLAHENGIKLAEAKGELEPVVVKKSTDRDPAVAIEHKELPPRKLTLIAASDRFAKIAPGSDKLPNVLFKAAEIYYTYDHFEEARRRFLDVLERYPTHEVAEFATNLIIESHLAEKNYAAVETFSREMLAKQSGTDGGRKEFAGELLKFKSGAMFKLAEDEGEKGNFERAAELYLQMVDENPENQFADSALNNAAVSYEKVKRYESASKLYERLVKDYPKSPLADTALFRVGLNAERFFDFDKAIESYLHLVKSYQDSERRPDATYNAALSLENTQQYEAAAKQYLRYCDLFPDRADAPAVCFRAGLVYEKMGATRKVISTYESFVRKYRKNPEHQDRVIEAQLKIAEAYQQAGDERKAKNNYESVVKAFARASDPKSAPYAAEAQFELVERQFAQFRKLKLEGNSKQQQRALTKKAEALKKVEDAYKAILELRQINWTLASLFRIGQAYQSFADSIIGAPCPPDVKRTARQMGMTPEEVCDEYRILLEEKAINIEDKAVLAYETTITRAREFQVANEWTQQTLVALNKLRRALWPLQKDAKSSLAEVAIAAMPVLDAAGRPVRTEVLARDVAPPSDDVPANKVAEGEGSGGGPPPQAPAPAPEDSDDRSDATSGAGDSSADEASVDVEAAP